MTLRQREKCLACGDPTHTLADLKPHPDPAQYPQSRPIGNLCAVCLEATKANDRATRQRYLKSGLIKPRISNGIH